MMIIIENVIKMDIACGVWTTLMFYAIITLISSLFFRGEYV